CNAPQIRVEGAGAEGLPTTEPAGVHLPNYRGAGDIQWSDALPSAALDGLIAAFLMFIPLGAFGLGMLAAGVLCVVFYRRRNLTSHLTPGMGARLGLVSGTLGFGIFAIFSAIGTLVFHTGGQLRAAMLEAIEQSAARSSDPQAQQIIEYLKTPPGLVLMMGLSLGVVLVAFLVLSSIGGAVGAAMMRRKDRM
ncbi:MAG: hypothetical protein ACRDL7_13520, partial [Gaiellaceae bacterium]